MTENRQAMERAMTLAALSGFKIALGPAFLETARRGPSARNWVMAAMGEMLLDKVGIFPARFRPSLLIPHTLAGAWVAHQSLKEDGVDDPMGALMGAVVAAGVAAVAPMARITGNRVLGVPDVILGAAEDYLALHLGSQATGLSMTDVCDTARETLEGARDQVMPMLEGIGAS